jgi:hypothetical protein
MKGVRLFLFGLIDGLPGRFKNVRAARYKLLRKGDKLPDGSTYAGISGLDGAHVFIEKHGSTRRESGRTPAEPRDA